MLRLKHMVTHGELKIGNFKIHFVNINTMD